MKAAVIVYPGSNCDRDLAVAFERAGAEVTMVWHKDTALPAGLDIVGVPGGFSYGDYLRCGAIAAQSPITRALADFVHAGGHAIGICNGFQVLTETGLLPGALMRNSGLKFICRSVGLRVATTDSVFTRDYSDGQVIHLPVAHHDGNYVCDPDTLKQLQDEDRIAFTYTDNPNGSVADIAGVLSGNRRVLGLMPHPERAVDDAHGGTDGAAVFRAVAGLVEAA
ncbi:phosphoribosylformylglycinamidine synthase subunit PurQ [Psychromarinibacter halotolerans]|uniref:Phosphoribosylformylglycinamidine synthase subunit PurQ n=1 Tax=Psychromarinibacter halotolerans TaxID=1775175 RepID=A0ABV7GUP0_9RHOB|nr:phosphoribosylformylglycinamidine synthase subunit PurQ [Psychromarinibacter halotolerans]MAQ82549.1 phosphoribosylformylglycinamidine synthase I [Maritimibacter sp.]MDF0594984.1 phosphoribosylformylglycinamidine synthase subunit PurQ [Psychromarinibacter halotolerans]